MNKSNSEVPKVALGRFLEDRPRNGYSPVGADEWTGMQALGLGCLSPDGFRPVQLKNVPARDARNRGAILSDGDLLVSRANTRALVGLSGVYRDIGGPCVYPDLMMRLVPNRRVIPEFLDLLLRSQEARRQIMAMAQGTSESMVKISGSIVMGLQVRVPGLDEQRRIVKVFDALDDQRAQLTSAAVKAMRMRMGIEEAVLTRTQSNSTLASAFQGRPRNGIYVPSSYYGDVGTPIVRIDSIRNGEICSVNRLLKVDIGDGDVKAFRVRESDIVINRVNSIDYVGKSALVGEGMGAVVYESNIMRCRVREDRYRAAYVAAWLSAPIARSHFRIRAKSAVAQASINSADVLSCPIPEISLDRQDEIVRSLADVRQAEVQVASGLAKLNLLKKGLMEDLLSGKVRV